LRRIKEETKSQFNGHEIITLEDLYDLPGPKLRNPIPPRLLTLTFNKSTATKSEDAAQATPQILMEETMVLEMEASSPAKLLSPYLETLPMEDGLFNGLGSEEPLRWEITTHAWTSPSLEDLSVLLLHSS